MAAGRSVQSQFDDAIACLQLALSELRSAHDVITLNGAREGGKETLSAAPLDAGTPPDGLGADVETGNVIQGLEDGVEVSVGDSQAAWLLHSQAKAAALEEKLVEWQQVVGSHQSASRVLRWSTSGGGASP